MATVLETEIENPDYINFLKVGLGLKELQRGLGPFIESQLQTIHGSITSRFGGSECGKCTCSNVLLHEKCSKRGCICRKQPAARRLCPSQNCVIFYNEMVKQHRFGDPQLLNSDVSIWFSDPWEFGKCFMLPHSSDNKTSVTQCDTSALLTLIINCIPFEKVVGVTIQTPPKTPKDVFSEVREIRNSAMHSETFAVSEADMESALDTIISALQSGLLQHDADANRAATEIQKLKDKAFVVTRPLEKDVLEDKLNAIEELLSRETTDIKCNIDQLVDTMAEIKTKLHDEVHERKDQIDDCKQKIEKQSQKHDLDVKRLIDADEELNSKINANSLKIQTLEDFYLKKLRNKDVERLIDDAEADLETHRGNIEQQNLPNNSRLTNSLLQTLRANHILVLTGNSGAGKTYQSLQILSLIAQTGDHKPVIIRDYEDIKHVVSYEEPLCILLDDIFGKYSLNNDALAKWNQYMDTLVSKIKRKKFLLVITLNSVREKQCLKENAYKTITQYSTNLDDNGLTREEKNEMARMCIVGAGDDMIKELAAEKQLPLGFPLLCQLAKDNTDINKLKTESLQYIIGNMEPSSFILLLLTLLTAEQFDQSCIRKKENTVMANCVDEIKEHLCSYTCTTNEILSKAESMIGSYLLRNESGMLKFSHHAVLEATFKSAIEKHFIDLLIEYCDLRLLLKLTHNLQSQLTEERVDTLLKRINNEHVPATQFASCPLWTEGQFQDQAVKYFANELEFFITCDGNGDSPFVAFSALGLQLFLTKILNMKWKLPNVDLENQTELALLEACSHGHLKCVEVLFNQQGTSVRDEHMFRCIQSGNVELFEYLTAKGGCIKATNERNRKNVLHEACIQKNPTLVKRIITCNSTPDTFSLLNMQMTETAETPLCLAVRHCDVETVKYLIDSGSDVHIRDGSGHNILHLALLYDSDDVVQFIEEQYPNMILEVADNGDTTAMYAAFRGNLQRLHLYIELGVDPHAITTFGLNILTASACYGRKDVMRVILETYPEIIHQTNVSKINAAHYAAAGGYIDCLETLINHGIDPLSRTSTQKTLLHTAARNKQSEAVDYLCKKYPLIINLTDVDKSNAAHYAAAGGDIDCLETLINHGVDPLSRTSTQRTLLHIASRYKHHEAVDYLCKRYPLIIQMTDEAQLNAAHYAAAGGDIDCLETLINHGIYPLSRTSTQRTLLHIASRYKHHEAVDYLCKKYPLIIQMTDGDQYNAAHAAAAGGDIECLETLINHGIDPLSRTSTQETLLHTAARNKQSEAVDYLCKKYPLIIHLTAVDQYNAAHDAAAGGDIDCLETLINHGLDPLSRTSSQDTLLHVAAYSKQSETVDYLCKSYPHIIQLTNKGQYNAAHYAARGGNIDCLKTLINHGIDPLSRTSSHETLLHVAAYKKHPEIVDYLCKSYPHIIQLTNKDQHNAAHYAARGGNIDCLKSLINHGIDPLSRTSTQQTLLHIAAIYKHAEAVDYLCKSYPPIIQLTNKGQYNAAHYAARGGNIDCLKTLINHGIDPLSKTSSQETLLHVAAYNKHPETVDYLCKSFPPMIQLTDNDQYNAAHDAARGGDIECLKTLINHGIDPLSRTSTQKTLLHVAAYNKHPETVYYLCKSYPHIIPLTNNDQYNAAHYAARGGNIECLKSLINHGIDPLSRTSSHETLLHVAAYNKHPETVDYLCKSYPHIIQLTDKDQYNAAHYAARGVDLDSLKTLITHGIDPLSRHPSHDTLIHVAEVNHHLHVVEYLRIYYQGSVPDSPVRRRYIRCVVI